jgi:hypothetical protein
MATLYITELATQGQDARGWKMVVADQPPVAEQTVAIGASSVQSSAFNALTKFIRINTDAACSVAFGTNPTATATKMRLAANTTEYFSVPLGASYKVAVITNS